MSNVTLTIRQPVPDPEDEEMARVKRAMESAERRLDAYTYAQYRKIYDRLNERRLRGLSPMPLYSWQV